MLFLTLIIVFLYPKYEQNFQNKVEVFCLLGHIR